MSEFKWDDCSAKELLRKVTSYEAPEHWQKEIDAFKASKQPKPEWEILAYDDAVLSDVSPIPITKEHLKWNYAVVRGFPILSVRRSDGEVFTVGQQRLDKNGEMFDISSFKILDGEMTVKSHTGTEIGLHWLESRKDEAKLMQVGAPWLTKENQEFLDDLGSGKVKLKPQSDEMPVAANGKVPVWLTPERLKRLEDMITLHQIKEESLKIKEPRSPLVSSYSIHVPDYPIGTDIWESAQKLVSEYQAACYDRQNSERRIKLAEDRMREIFTIPAVPPPEPGRDSAASDRDLRFENRGLRP